MDPASRKPGGGGNSLGWPAGTIQTDTRKDVPIMDNQIKRRIPAPELYLPGGQPFGRASSRAVARRVDRQADGVMGQAALAHVTDQARAVLAAGALHNIGALAGLAEQCAQVAPAGGPYYQAVLKAYGLSAARGVAEL